MQCYVNGLQRAYIILERAGNNRGVTGGGKPDKRRAIFENSNESTRMRKKIAKISGENNGWGAWILHDFKRLVEWFRNSLCFSIASDRGCHLCALALGIGQPGGLAEIISAVRPHVCDAAAIGIPGSFAPSFHSEKLLGRVLESRHRSQRCLVGFAPDADTATLSATISRVVKV